MNHKSLILSLSIICLASLLFSCDDQDSTDIEPVVEEEIFITEVPDEEGDLGGRSNLGSVVAAPGLYGPTSVKAGQTYTYNLVLPAGYLKKHPGKDYGIDLNQRCRGCTIEESSASSNFRRFPYCCSTVKIKFPTSWKGDNIRFMYWYNDLLYSKRVIVN